MFYSQLQTGQTPSVSFIQMSPSHSGHPGSSSITAAANWLDQFVKQVQSSTSWNDTAIIVIWDEGGGWYDHVPPPQLDSQGLGNSRTDDGDLTAGEEGNRLPQPRGSYLDPEVHPVELGADFVELAQLKRADR